uniref:Papilin, proteoglycan like sulfated glycoprotein n=1 Tax=Podarcis muralis TaxID=64176 RepID=A0A670I4U8_PODMU
WGDCSRSCGGGVSFRQRRCYSIRADGGFSCIGPTRNYRSCNVKNCPEGSRDFRAEQCAEFDGIEFQGKRYKWLPYYGAPNKCELNCIPKGENFYYRHKDTVTDGTPCEPGKHDICVEGVCQAVGCDNILDSSKKEDKCLQCGGDGRACFEVKGFFDVPNLPKGYNQIFIIPMGATSIRIKEATPTRNFLAIKNAQGAYYLNGHWTIEFSRALHIASTVVHYDRGSEGDLAPELLHARGPTTEPLVIELINQEPNQGVHYEYYLPTQRQSLGYSWAYGSWGECSAECGGGYQTRLVFCTIDNEVYPDYMCRDKPQPENNQTCGLQPCPQTKRWKIGEWGACSATCGGGTQTRSVYCVSHHGPGSQNAVDDAECASLTERPRSTQPCNMRQCAAWTTGPWSEVTSCGEGIQTRTVNCMSELGTRTLEVACLTQPKPSRTQSCTGENCIQEIGWHIGDWGLVSIATISAYFAIGKKGTYTLLYPSLSVHCCPSPLCTSSHMNVSHVMHLKSVSVFSFYNSGWFLMEYVHAVCYPLPTVSTSPLTTGSSASRHFSSHQNVASTTEVQDCNQSLHGCCSDGQTVAAGPFGQGCPFDTCHQSRYGCCPDGISPSQGPNKEGCPQYYSDVYVNRNEPAVAAPTVRVTPDILLVVRS